MIDFNKLDFLLLTKLYIVILELNNRFLEVNISFLIPLTFNVHEESIVNILPDRAFFINLARVRGHLIKGSIIVISIIEVGVDDG